MSGPVLGPVRVLGWVRLAIGLLVVLWATGVNAQPVPGWELRIPERVELVAGVGGTLSIAIAVDRGLSISKDAGILIDLAPDSAIAIKRRRLGRSDAVDPGGDAPRFAVALRADAVGDFGMRVRIRFWLCGKKVCRPIEARRNVAIAVATPPPATP